MRRPVTPAQRTAGSAAPTTAWRSLPCATAADRLALRALVERRVGGVVAEHLGVGVDDLGPRVSLRDDLAADSLDLVEMAVGLEGAFEVSLPDRVLIRARCYGELVESIVALVVDAAGNALGRPAMSPRPDAA